MDKERETFLDNITESCEISCSRCFKTRTEMNSDIFDFMEDILRNGWKVKKYRGIDEVVCPECVKKYFTKGKKK